MIHQTKLLSSSISFSPLFYPPLALFISTPSLTFSHWIFRLFWNNINIFMTGNFACFICIKKLCYLRMTHPNTIIIVILCELETSLSKTPLKRLKEYYFFFNTYFWAPPTYKMSPRLHKHTFLNNIGCNYMKQKNFENNVNIAQKKLML